MFERAVQEALLAADERKRRALARAVVSGLLAGDTAAIDEAQLRIRAVTMLEPPHLRILFALERPGEMQGHPVEQMAYTSIQLGQQTGVSTELLALLLAKLAAEGLISDVSSTVESRTGAGTPFGRSRGSGAGSSDCCGMTRHRGPSFKPAMRVLRDGQREFAQSFITRLLSCYRLVCFRRIRRSILLKGYVALRDATCPPAGRVLRRDTGDSPSASGFEDNLRVGRRWPGPAQVRMGFRAVVLP